MTHIQFNYNDGGRAKYFKAQGVGDCVVRAAAIAAGRDYKEVYDMAARIAKESPRNGMKHSATRKLMTSLGGVWTPLMQIGTGCKVHLRADELPAAGRYVLSVSKHVTAYIDGVLNDTYDCSREGTRCVYGYWKFEA